MRISGVTLPKEKKIGIALAYLKGIGLSAAAKVLQQAGVDENIRTKDLTEEQEAKIRGFIEGHYKIEGDLVREVLLNIKRLKEIKSYRGIRHMKHLPVRGQSTKTNNRTVRGNVRKSAGSGRKLTGLKT